MSIQLKIQSQFINPQWLRQVQSGVFECEIAADYRIELKGEYLIAPADSGLNPGDKVRVWFGRNFYCESLSAYQEQQKERELKELEETRLKKLSRNKCREETIAFNASLNIPYKWQTGFKDVLSGLSENSWGDGRSKATVGHIELLEDVVDGRLRRKAGEFLCSKDTGKQWTGDSHLIAVDGDGNEYNAKVTCKACLKAAKRWSNGN